MKHKVLMTIACVVCAMTTAAQTDDDNVVISNAKDCYVFSVDRHGKVTVRNEREETYTASRTWANIEPCIFYGQQSRIEDASLRRHDALYKNVTPDGVFSNDTKVCYFRVGLKKKGETATPKFVRVFDDPRFLARITFGNIYYIKDKIISIKVPAELKQFIVRGVNLPECVSEAHTKTDDGADLYTYTIRDMEAVPDDPNQPDNKSAIVITGSFADYKELYMWSHDMLESVDCKIENIYDIVSKATAGAKNDVERIAKTLAWVQDNIRYVAVEVGEMAWKPDAPSEVIRKKYGDCKGMSLLLRTLLRHQGIEANVADVGSVNALTKISEVPALCSTDHMVCVAKADGKEFWLDATNRFADLGYAQQWTSGCEAIVEDGHECRLVTMPVADVWQSVDSVTMDYSLRLGEDKPALHGTLVRTLSGEVKESILTQYAQSETPKKPKLIASLVYALNKDGIAVEWQKITGEDGHAKTATVSAKLKNTKAVEELDDEIYVDLNPSSDPAIEVINTEKRKSDYVLPTRFRRNVTATLTLPKNVKVESLPEAFSAETRNVRVEYSCQMSGTHNVVMRKSILVKNKRIALGEIEEWNKLVGQWNDACNEQIVLKKK